MSFVAIAFDRWRGAMGVYGPFDTQLEARAYAHNDRDWADHWRIEPLRTADPNTLKDAVAYYKEATAHIKDLK